MKIFTGTDDSINFAGGYSLGDLSRGQRLSGFVRRDDCLGFHSGGCDFDGRIKTVAEGQHSRE